MLKHILVKQKFWQLIMHWSIIFGIFLVLTACGDLVKESETGACNSAIDARNYDKALSVCTSRQDKASALMGKAGYDIINMLKSSGSSATAYTAPSDVSLGTDDVTGASILNFLQLSRAVIPDNDTRAEKISESRTNLDSASAELQDYLGDNSSAPLDVDEILLNTFAIAFAMQLNQIMIFDNETTSKTTFPSGSADNLSCTQVTNYDSAAAIAVLIPSDGHIWAAERDGMMCARIKNAIEDNASGAADIVSWMASNKELHSSIYATVCGPLESLTIYLSRLALNLTELKKAISLSGDNTKVLELADNSTKAMMAAVGCVK